MGVRRERPPVERAGTPFRLRLPDGTVKTMGVADLRGGRCCFCGEDVERSELVELSARWSGDGAERTQTWAAHRSCLADRLHESAGLAGGR